MTVESELADLLDSTAPSCRLRVGQDEGPYYRDLDLERRDITEDREGVPLRVGVRLVTPGGGPLAGALVEVWHADREGQYSGFPVETSGRGETFLRGGQHTDARGMCAFDTIYPGWYPGRTVHIHLIAHLDESSSTTTQLFFPDAVNDEVLGQPGYDTRGARDTTNATDDIFSNNGAETMLTLTPGGAGYVGLLCAAVGGPVN
jgi:protocatechuate 3,4-dioxygenase beta subunit